MQINIEGQFYKITSLLKSVIVIKVKKRLKNLSCLKAMEEKRPKSATGDSRRDSLSIKNWNNWYNLNGGISNRQ